MSLNVQRLLQQARKPKRGCPLTAEELEKLALSYESDAGWIRRDRPEDLSAIRELAEALREDARALRRRSA